jgi:hypothetical protein
VQWTGAEPSHLGRSGNRNDRSLYPHQLSLDLGLARAPNLLQGQNVRIATRRVGIKAVTADACHVLPTLLDVLPDLLWERIGMFEFTSMIMPSVARRAALALALALPASSLVVIAGAVPQASACTASSHCYAEAVNTNTNSNHGVAGVINSHCLYQPNNNNRASNELWDIDSSGSNWVEVGITSGVDYHGTYRDKDWFWADKRPGNAYSEHDTSVSASADTSYLAEIEFAGGNAWGVFGENSGLQFGTSTNNTATLITPVAGTEYEGGSTSGIRDVGNIYSLERESSGNVWHFWGSSGVNENLGSGNYINGNYDPNAYHESWSGPC